MHPVKLKNRIQVSLWVLALAVFWSFVPIGHAQEVVDLLPFFCPACVGEGTNQRNLVGGECFYTYSAEVKGRSGFNIVKSCGDMTVFEEFAYDGNNIYHLADTSWATWNGSSWTAAKCYDGRIAYSTYLNGNFGSQNGSCDGFNPNMGSEGNLWVPRHMAVGQQPDNLPTTIVAMAKDSCSCCQAQYTGPTGRWVKLVSKEAMDLGIGVGTKDVVRIAIMDGPGKGENFWYARNYGWVAFGQIDPPDGNLSYYNVTHIHGVDNNGHQRQATCGGTPPVQPPGNCINSVSSDRWKGEYFNNENLSGSPAIVKDDGNGFIDFDWGYGGPNTCGVGTDYFSARWTKNFPPGIYNFTMTVDDGGRLYVNGTKVLDQWKVQAPTAYTVGPITIASAAPVVFEYFEHNVGAVAKLTWQKIGDVTAPPSTGFKGSTGWENGEAEGAIDEVMYSLAVGAYPGGSRPECSRRSGEFYRTGSNALMIAGSAQADRSYCYYRVFDNLNIPVTSKTKIGYYILHIAGSPQVAIDGYFTDGSTIRDSGIVDQNQKSMHPAYRPDEMNKWVYVEANLSPVAGKTLKTLIVGFDNGGNKFQGPYRAYVDDLQVFEGTGTPPTTCLATVPENRWKGEYFNNENLTGSPSMVKDDGDGLITNDWGMGGPNACGIGTDNFSVRWTRKVDFPPGMYVFKMTVDDGGRLYIDGDKKLDQWKTQPPTEYPTGSIALSGNHTVAFEYFEHNVGAVAKLRWDKVGELPITTCQANVPGNRWKGEYFNNQDLSGLPAMIKDDGDGVLSKQWASTSPGSDCGIGADHFSVRWTKVQNFSAGLYTFTMAVDDGGRFYIDGEKKLDGWKDQAEAAYTTGQIALSGDHTLKLEYYENAGDATAKLSWIKVGDLPITTCQASVAANHWKGEYFKSQDLSGTAAMTKDDGDGALNKVWGAASPSNDCGIPVDHFSVRWTKTQNFASGLYTFTMAVDDGGRFYIDGNKQLDGWKDQSETPYTTGQIALSGDHPLKLEYYENAGDATAKLSWTRVGDIPPTPNPTGKSKLSVQSALAGGGHLTKGFVQQAQPVVVKIVDDMGQVPVIRQLAPNAIIIGRIYIDDGLFPAGAGNPEDKAVEFHNMIKGKMIGGVDYWEGLNERAMPGKYFVEWYGRFEKKRVELLAAEGKKACIGTFSVGVPDVTDPTVWPLFYPAIDAALAHGGAMCVHEYSAPTMKYAFNESNQNVYDAAPGTGYCQPGEGYLTGRYRRVYRQHLIPDNKVIPLFITECGIDGGVAGSAPSKPGWKVYYQNTECQGTDTDGVSKQAKCYFNELVWYDNLLRQDDYVKGATIFSLEQPDWDNFDIGGDVLNLLTAYVKDGTAPEPITPPVTPPPVTPPPSTPSFSSGWEDAQRDGQPGVEMYRKEVIGYSNTSGSLPEVKRQSGEQVHGGSFALKVSGTSKANYAYSYQKIYENLNLTITSGMKLTYYIYHAEGSGQIAIDGIFKSNETLRDLGAHALKDQHSVPIHPALRKDPLGQWYYVEVDLTLAVGKVLDVLMVAFDNGNLGYQGRYLAYVDDLNIAVASTTPPPVQPPSDIVWDSRLDGLDIKLEQASASSGQTYWRLVKALLHVPEEPFDPTLPGGDHHIYIELVDEQSNRMVGQKAVVKNGGTTYLTIENKPYPDYGCNYGMYGMLGSYSAWADGMPSDKVTGMGLPMKQHVTFYLTFQKATK